MEQPEPMLELTVNCDACGTPFSTLVNPAALMNLATQLPEGTSEVHTICADCRAKRFSERHLYEAWAGDRVRVAIPHAGTWQHIFWIRVSRDGDVYCTFGYGDDHIGEPRIGTAQTDGAQVRVNYADPTRNVRPPFKGGRVSFHASGQINLGDSKLVGTPLQLRTKQEVLAVMVFAHPSAFPPLGAVGDRDILLPYTIGEGRVLVGAVHFVPPSKPIDFVRGVQEIAEPRRELAIRFDGVDGSTTGDLTVYMELGLATGACPPLSYLLVQSVRDAP